MSNISIFGEHDQRTIDQLRRCVDAEEGALGALMPDGHVGYSMPIGGVVAYREHVSPSGVGFDIGCGNKAVMTNLYADDIAEDIVGIMDEVVSRISFGVGRANGEPVDHPVLSQIALSPSAFQRQHLQLARDQLGTVGAGNHYVDIFYDESTGGQVWIGCHFGSRGFGHKTASHYLALAGHNDGDMDSPPALLSTHSDLGQAYIHAMQLAGDYAMAGRDIVCNKVLEILGAEERYSVHNHHNYAWYEEHGGEWFWVVRKGATPAFPGQEGFVGSSMGEDSVILCGVGHHRRAGTLYSTVHGAGRAMSRTQAAGKFKRVKRNGRWTRIQKSRGEVNWRAVQDDLAERGIELRGGAADEAPQAYKRLSEVLSRAPGIAVETYLTPIGVAMAGADTYDPYKD